MASRSRLSQTQNLGSAAGSMTLSIAHSSPPVYERASRTRERQKSAYCGRFGS